MIEYSMAHREVMSRTDAANLRLGPFDQLVTKSGYVLAAFKLAEEELSAKKVRNRKRSVLFFDRGGIEFMRAASVAELLQTDLFNNQPIRSRLQENIKQFNLAARAFAEFDPNTVANLPKASKLYPTRHALARRQKLLAAVKR